MEAEKRDGECDDELDSENKSLTTTKDGEDVEGILKSTNNTCTCIILSLDDGYGKHS